MTFFDLSLSSQLRGKKEGGWKGVVPRPFSNLTSVINRGRGEGDETGSRIYALSHLGGGENGRLVSFILLASLPGGEGGKDEASHPDGCKGQRERVVLLVTGGRGEG